MIRKVDRPCKYFRCGPTDATASACDNCDAALVQDRVSGLVQRGVRSIIELVSDSGGVGIGSQWRGPSGSGSKRHRFIKYTGKLGRGLVVDEEREERESSAGNVRVPGVFVRFQSPGVPGDASDWR